MVQTNSIELLVQLSETEEYWDLELLLIRRLLDFVGRIVVGGAGAVILAIALIGRCGHRGLTATKLCHPSLKWNIPSFRQF